MILDSCVLSTFQVICYCMGQLNSIMPLTVNYLMLSMIILMKLADCDSISPFHITAIGTS